MASIFLSIINMSITGAFVIFFICLARLPLKKSPKIISYCLWAAAWFRLAFPYSIKSDFSLLPFNVVIIPSDIAMQAIPRINSGISGFNNTVSGILPAAVADSSINPLQVWMFIGSWVWFTGTAVMLVYGLVSYLRVKYKIRAAVCAEENIYEFNGVLLPFVLGIFKPRIYIPKNLSPKERGFIILHEKTHIRRHDYIVKFAAYFILCLHWFNPFAWAAFLLMSADMEMSCDERVLKEMGGEAKKEYSLSLLSLASGKNLLGGSSAWIADKQIVRPGPLAFGESSIKGRIKNVMNFKNHKRAAIIFAVIFAASLGAGFSVNKTTASEAFTVNTSTNDTKLGEQIIPRFNNLSDFTKALNERGMTFVDSTVYPHVQGVINKDNLDIGRLSEDTPILISSEADVDLLLEIFKLSNGEQSSAGFGLDTSIDEAINSAGLEDYWLKGVRQITKHGREQALIDLASNYTREELEETGLFDRPEMLEELQSLGFYLDESSDSGLSKAEEPYPRNKNGNTYGTAEAVGKNLSLEYPDLIACEGIDGTIGYCYKSDIDGEQPSNPEEAIVYMEELENQIAAAIEKGEEYLRYIPLYESDGETVIGTFGIGY